MARKGTKGTAAGKPALIIPLDRDVTPEERARLVRWLASPDTQLALQAMQRLRPDCKQLAWRVVIPPQISQNFLSMQQGWDLAVETIQAVATPPRPAVTVDDDFFAPTEQL